MTRIAVVIAAVFVFATAVPTLPAQAQNSRSFVSATGLDTNACTLAAPCRSFLGAYNKTNAGGEIDVLDTAGYGPLTITHAISIVNDGGTASVLIPSGGIGFTINATGSDAISLRGLTFEGAGVGLAGIQFNTGQSLTVKNCVIRHVSGDGITFTSSISSSLFVSDTLLADSGGGIALTPIVPIGTPTILAVINRVEVNNSSGDGILLSGAFGSSGIIVANVSESVLSGNATGVGVISSAGELQAKVTLFHSVIANNSTGVSTNGTTATITIAQSAVTGNAGSGWANSGGVIQTYQDNYFNDNGTNTGSLTNVNKL